MQYDMYMARLVQNDLDPSAVMQHTPIETIKSILGRCGVEYEDGFPKDVYVCALLDTILEEEKLLLYLLTEDTYLFLMDVWEEEDMITMEPYDWNHLEYLKILGLLAYRKGNPLTKEPHEIHIFNSMKDRFYFALKSKMSRKLVEKYSRWERVAAGLLFYYGLLSVETCYDLFTKAVGPVDYEEFYRFIKLRSSLWSIGSFLSAEGDDKEYFCLNEVNQPDLLLLYTGSHPNLDYKSVSAEDLIYLSEAGGIDNRWRGVSRIGLILVDELQMNEYRATAVVRNLIHMIQNGEELDKVLDQVDIVAFQTEEFRDDLMEGARMLFDSVPVYEYKGHSHKEFYKIEEEIELKKRRETFTIIEGWLP